MFAGSTFRLAAGCVFTALLVLACLSDLRHRRIPNPLVALIAAGGLAFSMIAMPAARGFGHGLAGIVVGLLLWLPFYLLRFLGAGDVKLLAAAGAWLGVGATLRASLFAVMIGGALALATLLWQRRTRDALTGVAVWASTLPSGRLAAPTPVTTARHQLPYGIALALGALLAAWAPRFLA